MSAATISRFSKLAIAGMAFAALAGEAKAADPALIPMAAPVVEKAAELMTEFSSGWYLRGDVGYRWNRVDSAYTGAGAALTSNKLGEAVSVGGGVGYSRDWFRVDVTLDYGAPANYTALSGGVQYSGHVDTFSALANAYIDMGTWMGLTPYIGAGAGVASVRTTDFIAGGIANTIVHANRANFAWAYMAGLSYRVSNNLLVDVGYRHMNYGNSWTGVDTLGNQVTIRGVSSDEVRVGMRYQID